MSAMPVIVLKDVPQSETGLSCYFTSPGSNSDAPVEYFRILRIVYAVRPFGVSSSSAVGLEDDPPRLTTAAGASTMTTTTIERRPSAISLMCAPNKTSSSTPPTITYETFTPELVRTAISTTACHRGPFELVDKVETMNETFSKVIAFLQNSGQYHQLVLGAPTHGRKALVVFGAFLSCGRNCSST